VVLGEYLDRREEERVGCKEGEEKCDVFRGSGESGTEHGDSSAKEMDVEGAEWEAEREERQ
jgi:hypothetical protein